MEKDIKKLRRKLKDIEFEIKNLDKSYYLSKTNIMENEEKIERMEESMKKVIGPLTTLIRTYLKKKYDFIDDVEVKYELRLPESFTYYAIFIKIKLDINKLPHFDNLRDIWKRIAKTGEDINTGYGFSYLSTFYDEEYTEIRNEMDEQQKDMVSNINFMIENILPMKDVGDFVINLEFWY